ncbi:hypothetical protein AB6A40_000308 [Gnathostoma spinigerum]|uniref:Uncharacterized protein n=1 Tax=Gnathostoma spinigerum TaxID=75299 RepID=A0ABD6E660_9BILA
MQTDEDSEIECAVVNRVANVTLESDSLPETSPTLRNRRKKKRVVKRMNREQMDVDVLMNGASTFEANNIRKFGMDWEELYSTSELSSSDTCSSDGREADDEQSDWVDAHDLHSLDHQLLVPSATRPRRPVRSSPSCSLIYRRLERFMRDDSQRELLINHWTRSHKMNRALQYFGLKISKRSRGSVLVKKTAVQAASV